MSSSRLEAFSDGVLAIIITIMVLELKVPETASIEALSHGLPEVLAYILSFLYVAIYWNNHHHLAKSITAVNPKILWANMFWLLCISFIPWSTAWLDKFYTSSLPVMTYCFVLLMTAIAYYILQHQIKKTNKKLKDTLGYDLKGKISVILYLFSFIIAQFSPFISLIGVVLVAIIWLIPDKRIEKIF